MKARIDLEQFYPYPVESVWEVLTTPSLIAEWLMNNNFEPRVGHRFRFQTKPMPGWNGIVDCEVVEVDRPRQLSYSWQGAEKFGKTIVKWTLRPERDGTVLRLEHGVFEGVPGFILAKLMMGPGWKKKMKVIITKILERRGAQ
jgi:uncharacterized protein YndB with AHSA1/START domain